MPRIPVSRNIAGQLVFLGTGTSHGVPVIGCDCVVCSSTDPRNQRYRSSAWVEVRDGDATRSLLIDTATELRLQARRANLRRVDAVLFTHAHADHVGGLDDVRRFNDLQRASIPGYGNAETVGALRRQYGYAFEPGQHGGGKPRLELSVVEPGIRFAAAQVAILPIGVRHGCLPILGYRIGDFAYVTDVSDLPAAALDSLAGLDLLVLGALRWRPHPTHLSVEQALAVVERLRPKRALFTHICHDLDHEATCERLPPGVALAYDGLRVESQNRP
jgi:phosphoribosyl 1,2-cyclic phosphate phosphodiesterase